MKPSNNKTLKKHNLNPRGGFPKLWVNQEKTLPKIVNPNQPNEIKPTVNNLNLKGDPSRILENSFRPRHIGVKDVVLVIVTSKWCRW